MTKYDSLKFLKETKAIKSHTCDRCTQDIRSGETYYKESVGKVNTPSLILRGFCSRCYREYGDGLLVTKFG